MVFILIIPEWEVVLSRQPVELRGKFMAWIREGVKIRDFFKGILRVLFRVNILICLPHHQWYFISPPHVNLMPI